MSRTAPKIAAIVVGSLFWTVSLVGVLMPHHFLSGGVSGLALILYYLVGNPPVGLGVFVLNLPLFVLAYRGVSRSFFWLSLAGMLGYTLLVSLMPSFSIRVQDPMLAALLGGVISGVGSGVVYRAGGSGGGTEILGVLLSRRYGFRVGAITAVANTSVLLLGAALMGLEPALYSMVQIYVAATVFDRIIGGFNTRKSVFIISQKHEEIAVCILRELQRGVTRLPAEGGYTRAPRTMLYTVVALTELARLKELVMAQDRTAFMTVLSNLEVIGHGFQKPEDLAPPMFGTGRVPSGPGFQEPVPR